MTHIKKEKKRIGTLERAYLVSAHMHVCPDLMQLRASTLALGKWVNVSSEEAAVRPGRKQSLLRVMAFQHLLLIFVI